MRPAVDRRSRSDEISQIASPGAPAFAHRFVLVSTVTTMGIFIVTAITTMIRPSGSEWAVLRPGAGIAIGVAAWYPPRYSALIAVCAALATGLGSAVVGRSLLVCLGSAIVAGAETWIGSRILRGGAGAVPSLSDRTGLRRLMIAAIAVGITTAIGLGLTAFFALGVDQVLPTLGLSVTTHVLGMLLVAPLFFRAPPPLPPIATREVLAQWVVHSGIVAVAFYLTYGIPIAFLVLPTLVWSATRLPYRMFVVQLALTSVAISELSAAGFGAFGSASYGVVERTFLVGSLGVTITIMVFTVIVGSAMAATAQANLDAREKWGRDAILASVTGIGVVHYTDGELWLSEVNPSGMATLRKELPGVGESSRAAEIFAPAEVELLRTVLGNVTLETPIPWNVQLVTTQSGRTLEASMVALANSAPDRASFQFIDATEREIVRAQYAAERSRAVEIQAALVPHETLNTAGYEIAGRSMASRALGGDFYDWYARPDGFSVSLGDVMGKGTGPSILAATLRASLRLSGETRTPARTLGHLATVVAPDLSNASSFATMFTANVLAESGEVLYADAGHGLALICAADGTVTQLESQGLPLGILADSEWVDKTEQLHIGDTFVIFSDGVLDLFDGTLAAIDEVALMTKSAPTCEALIDQIFDLADSESLDDDISVVVIRRLALED